MMGQKLEGGEKRAGDKGIGKRNSQPKALATCAKEEKLQELRLQDL